MKTSAAIRRRIGDRAEDVLAAKRKALCCPVADLAQFLNVKAART